MSKSLHPHFVLENHYDVSFLISCLYRNSHIKYVKYKGKKYYETSNW